MTPRERIEKILWKTYTPGSAPNMEEITDELMEVFNELLTNTKP